MLELQELRKQFGVTTAVAGLSLRVARGEFVTLLGPSGCGKTTTLRMIAGFESPTSGKVLIDGSDITSATPQNRNIGMVFQSYALFPHLNVLENVAFGLKTRRVPKAEISHRVEQALKLVDLSGYGARPVQELSGGEQQRVALARALAPEPPLLLLDEPLSNLDAALRERTRDELRALLKRLELTALFVTHDQEEAFALSDRVALLDRGRLQQLATPEELYSNPANPFVAAFIGKANFLSATVEAAHGSELVCRLDAGTLWTARGVAGVTFARGDRTRLMLRPESLVFAPDSTDETAIPVRISSRRFAGAVTFYSVQAADSELLIESADPQLPLQSATHVIPRAGTVPSAYPDQNE